MLNDHHQLHGLNFNWSFLTNAFVPTSLVCDFYLFNDMRNRFQVLTAANLTMTVFGMLRHVVS
jgi:hypothetical protein